MFEGRVDHLPHWLARKMLYIGVTDEVSERLRVLIVMTEFKKEREMIPFIIVVAYMVFLIALSIAARQKQKRIEAGGSKTEGFLLASRSLGPVLVCFTLIGSALGANGTVGIAQNGYRFGISAFWYDGAFGIGVIVCALLFVSKLRKMNLTTISQVYGDFYGESTRVLVSLGQIFMQFCIMVSQYIAGGVILNALLPQYFSYTGGMITSAVIYIVIAMIGGMSSTALIPKSFRYGIFLRSPS